MTREQVDNIRWIKRYEVDLNYHHGVVFIADGMPTVRMVEVQDMFGKKTHYMVNSKMFKSYEELCVALNNL